MIIPLLAFVVGMSFGSATTTPNAPIATIAAATSTEAYVSQYFADTPVLVSIAKCESRFRQWNSDGSIHRGEINRSDLGVMQVNEYYHGEKADELGFDLYTLDGNLAYAKYLYEKEGSRPWASSQKCWGKAAKELAMK